MRSRADVGNERIRFDFEQCDFEQSNLRRHGDSDRDSPKRDDSRDSKRRQQQRGGPPYGHAVELRHELRVERKRFVVVFDFDFDFDRALVLGLQQHPGR
jgi:hypothetical protein